MTKSFNPRGVGSGTTVTNIEIIGSDDDGIEIFGGTVNVTNLTIWAQVMMLIWMRDMQVQ